jgi:hypothetical protein
MSGCHTPARVRRRLRPFSANPPLCHCQVADEQPNAVCAVAASLYGSQNVGEKRLPTSHLYSANALQLGALLTEFMTGGIEPPLFELAPDVPLCVMGLQG